MEMVLGVHCTWCPPQKEHLTLVNAANGQLKSKWKKQTCYPSSLSALSPLLSSTPFIPPSPPVLCWSEILEEQQALSVCSGITVCDFSLTSQAALWHGGVIVSGGWKPFYHGRVEKDKAVPQPLCLAEHCGLVSPAWWRIETGTWAESSHSGHGHFGFKMTSEKQCFDMFTYSLRCHVSHLQG